MSETAEVVAAIRELQEVTLWIQQHTDGMQLLADPRSRMAFGCLDLAIEHQAGIAVLADQPFWGAAFALLRCELDAFVRGVWLARCASDADLRAFQKRGLRDKAFAKMTAEVERALAHRRGVLTRLAISSWGMLSDFTHTGFQHVVRRNSPTHTGPNYPDGEKVHALRLATAIGLAAVVEFAGLSGNREIALAATERAKAVKAGRRSGAKVNP
jgi:hypothetical protein